MAAMAIAKSLSCCAGHGCITPTSSAGHAPASKAAHAQLMSYADHTAGAGHRPEAGNDPQATAATALVLAAFNDNLVFFYGPSELAAQAAENKIGPERRLRNRALVEAN